MNEDEHLDRTVWPTAKTDLQMGPDLTREEIEEIRFGTWRPDFVIRDDRYSESMRRLRHRFKGLDESRDYQWQVDRLLLQLLAESGMSKTAEEYQKFRETLGA